jgi:hypothetical protein
MAPSGREPPGVGLWTGHPAEVPSKLPPPVWGCERPPVTMLQPARVAVLFVANAWQKLQFCCESRFIFVST